MEEQSPCHDDFLSSPDYGYNGNIDDILEDLVGKLDTDLKDLEDPMDIEDSPVHQIQGAVGSLQQLDHVEFSKAVNQENDDMKSQEGSQIRGHVVVELDFNHSNNQILSQLNLPTRVKDMLEDNFKGWSHFDSQEASSSFTYHLMSDFMRQGEGLALRKVEMPRLAGTRIGVGGKRLREFVQNKKRKKLKVETTVGQNSGFKRKRTDMEDLILEEHNRGTGFKRIKEVITDMTMKAIKKLQWKKGIWRLAL
ncbi:uncharacterized protein G2W53_018635 [Senna tora]|uniref:Uncharacterized protein n=1 Tax=Senna tora TaxID=362788 RepID=A0A834TVM6_9FABA|nr:uncharacterized protein G2W53_018635 [Senna tora]